MGQHRRGICSCSSRISNCRGLTVFQTVDCHCGVLRGLSYCLVSHLDQYLPGIVSLADCKLSAIDSLADRKLSGIDSLADCKLSGIDSLADCKLSGIDSLADRKLSGIDSLADRKLPGNSRDFRGVITLRKTFGRPQDFLSPRSVLVF